MVQHDNLHVWKHLKGVDKKYTKKIVGKSYSGDSPNPTYVAQRLTEVFGPAGQYWGFEKIEHGFVGEGEDQIHWIVGGLWWKEDPAQERSYTIYHAGGTNVYAGKKGFKRPDEDFMKKSMTDAFVKCAAQLGCCADIFLGIYDTKYTSADHTVDSVEKSVDVEKSATSKPISGSTTKDYQLEIAGIKTQDDYKAVGQTLRASWSSYSKDEQVEITSLMNKKQQEIAA